MSSRSALYILSIAVAVAACSKPEAPATQSAASNRPPQPPLTVEDSTQRAEEVAGLVAKHLDAMQTGNIGVLDSLTSSDVTHVNPKGELTASEERFIQKHKSGTAEHYQVDKAVARIFEGDVAVVNAQLKEASGKIVHLTQVWVLRYDDVVPRTTTKTASASHGVVSFVSSRFRPLHAAVMCCAAARWELTASHASAASPSDPYAKPDLPNY